MKRKRDPIKVLSDPKRGDRVEWSDGEVWIVDHVEREIVAVHYRMAYPDGFVSDDTERMPIKIWADPMDEGSGSPFVCVPASDVPPPTP
jgi:hypothetical protein